MRRNRYVLTANICPIPDASQHVEVTHGSPDEEKEGIGCREIGTNKGYERCEG